MDPTIRTLIADSITSFKLLRELSISWRDYLDSDEYFTHRTAARGRPRATQMPFNQLTRFTKQELKYDINYTDCVLSDEAIICLIDFINIQALCRKQLLSCKIVTYFDKKYKWYFTWLIEAPEIDIKVIRKFHDRIPIKLVKRCRDLPDDVLCLLGDRYPDCIIDRYKLSETVLERLINNPDISQDNINDLCKCQFMSENFMRKHSNVLNWAKISKYQVLKESFIEEFATKVDWVNITRCQYLSVDFIKKHAANIDWERLYITQVFNQKELDEVIKFDPNMGNERWCAISGCCVLDEEFICKYSDLVDWAEISRHQKLSIFLLRKFPDKISWADLRENPNITLSHDEKIEFIDFIFPPSKRPTVTYSFRS